QWQGEQPRFSPDEADRLAGRLRSNAVAYAVVKKFSTRRHRMFLGMASGATTKVIVKIEIFLKEPGQALRSATGTGEATTKAKGVFFQIRQDTVYFDETAVGRAAHQAITNALKGL
ncbi:MAG: hypothetical protein GY868_14395, partial [Deltaproteobacteria bacterium]|nr:hypothetical protein [Deltaproteobacteria bacterium]